MAKTVITEDVKKEWLDPIRAAQAACKDNNGYGVVSLHALVNHNVPLLWAQPALIKIHPAKLIEYQMNPVLLGVFSEFVRVISDGAITSEERQQFYELMSEACGVMSARERQAKKGIPYRPE